MPFKKETRATAVTRKPAEPDYADFVGNPDFVLSLARGLLVIESFRDHTEGLTVADVSANTGLSRAATRRFLITLEMLGYAQRVGSHYRLGSAILKLGFSYLSSSSLPVLGLPILEQVSAAVHESASLSVLDADQVVYLARVATQRVMGINLAVGSRLPAYCTSMGRVLLSALQDDELAAHIRRVKPTALTPKTITDPDTLITTIQTVRSAGYAFIDGELELGLRSIAVPVRRRNEQVAAAMNIGVHAARATKQDMLSRFLPVLRENARRLGQMLE